MKISLNKENVIELGKETSAPAISIYLPLSNSLSGRKKDQINLENLLKNAAKQIINSGFDKSFARNFVEPGFVLAQDHFSWKTKAAGLAVFITAPQILRYFELPTAPKESIYVGKGFDTARIKKMAGDEQNFYLLAASKNNLALYKNQNGRFEKISAAGMPKSIKELEPDKTFESKLQSHGGGGKSELFHSQGQGKETEKVLLLRFFQIANDALRPVLAKKTEPLIFAGSPNLFPIFRKANTYPGLYGIPIKGSTDNILPEILIKKALELLKSA
ncbi:MAG: hypothetical protein WCX69_01275 [Candidatus Paceibacterota bacterium]